MMNVYTKATQEKLISYEFKKGIVFRISLHPLWSAIDWAKYDNYSSVDHGTTWKFNAI